MADEQKPRLSQAQQAFLLALARRICPETRTMGDETQQRFLAIIEEAVRGRPPAMQRQIGLFLHVLRWLPCLR